MNVYILALISTLLMFLATTCGSLFVFLIKKMSPILEKICLGLASGIMIAASIFSLLLPALEDGNPTLVVASILLGGFFLWLLDFICSWWKKGQKKSHFFLAVTLHNIPEGMIVGLACALAYQNNTNVTMAGVIALAIGIAVQNIPEGMAVSFALLEQGKGRWEAFLYGAISGVVEPIFGLLMVILSYQLSPLMPFFLSLAAGTMFYVVVDELIPSSKLENDKTGVNFFMIGFCFMMYLDIILG